MAEIVLRIAGASLDLDTCRAKLPASLVQRVWRIGMSDSVLNKTPPADNGINLLLADADDDAVAMVQALETLRSISATITELTRDDVRAVADIGLFVEQGQMHSIALPVALLDLLSSQNIALTISCYPVA